MALIKCKECGKEISDKAKVCVNCGIKIHNTKNIMKIVIVIVVLCLGIFIFSGRLTRFLTNSKNDKIIKKIEGTYVLTNNTFELLNNEIKIEKDNTYFVNEIEACQNEYKLIKSSQNKLLLITGFHMLAPYKDKHTDLDVIVCFNVENNKLKQTNCPNDGIPISLQNINLEYSRK